MTDDGPLRSLGGKNRYGLAKHGIANPRGQAAPVPGRSGRFGRLFPELPPADLSHKDLKGLIAAMKDAAGQSVANLDLPAGYTYLAQFVDHDLTFDPNSRLQTSNDPYTLVDYRTPRLDLDSVYGSGPMDQPFLYEWPDDAHAGERLLIGKAPLHDLARNQGGRALTGDARNDENKIISQLHGIFVRLHNEALEHVRGAGDGAIGVFETAQRLVRWHYQWVVLHDLLPRIVGKATADDVMYGTGRRHFRWKDHPYMPVEFSGAAYRFGHSLVREDYQMRDGQLNVPIMRQNPEDKPQLGGFEPLEEQFGIEWKHFFALTDDPALPQTAMSIDPSLSSGLLHLTPDGKSLVELNLLRGRALDLPSGRDVALAMGEPVLSADAITRPLALEGDLARAVHNSTPLWYYILCEALEFTGGTTLGPVGGRIVAEVIVGLAYGDPTSYLRQYPTWQPGQSVDGGRTQPLLLDEQGPRTMPDLVRFVEADEPAHRAPSASDGDDASRGNGQKQGDWATIGSKPAG